MNLNKHKIIKHLKKGLSACMTVALLLAFAACSGSDGVEDNYDDVLVEELEPVQLNFYAMEYSSYFDNKEIDSLMKEIEMKLADTIKVKPKFHRIAYDEYNDEIKKLIASGADIDAFMCYDIDEFEEYAKDITDLFPKYAPNYYNELMSSKTGQESVYSSSIDGKVLSVPANDYYYPRYFIIARKDLVERYAKNGLGTLEDYGEFLKNVKENEPGLIPGAVSSHIFFDSYIKGNGYYDYNSSVYFTWESEGKELYLMENTGEFIEAYSMLTDWRKKEYAPKDPLTYYSPPYISKGLVASMLIDIEGVRYANIGVTSDYEYKMYPLYMAQPHILSPRGWGVAVASNSKNAERVLMFLEWLHKSQENYDLFRYGIKDRHYGLQGENIVFDEGMTDIVYWNYVTNFFSDYRYERTSFIDTADYREAIKEAGLNNIKTFREVFGEIGQGQKDEEDSKKLDVEWQTLSPIVNKYNSNMSKFFENIDKGLMNITPEKLKEMQEEAGIDKVLEYYKNILQR